MFFRATRKKLLFKSSLQSPLRLFSSELQPNAKVSQQPVKKESEKILYRTMSPTVAQSFGKQFTDEEVKKYVDPKAFMNDIDMRNYEEVQPTKDAKIKEEPQQEKTEEKKEFRFNHNFKYKEYGFKTKGPEPTRHGDWEIKGRCTDF